MRRESEIDEIVREGGLASLGNEELLYLLFRLSGSGEKCRSRASLISRHTGSFYRNARDGRWQDLVEAGMTSRQSFAVLAAFELARRSNYRILPLSNWLVN